jgi:hypothetical protein
MATRDAPRAGNYVFIAVIFIAVLIDAVLFAIVHENFVHDRGYDTRVRQRSAALTLGAGVTPAQARSALTPCGFQALVRG